MPNNCRLALLAFQFEIRFTIISKEVCHRLVGFVMTQNGSTTNGTEHISLHPVLSQYSRNLRTTMISDSHTVIKMQVHLLFIYLSSFLYSSVTNFWKWFLLLLTKLRQRFINLYQFFPRLFYFYFCIHTRFLKSLNTST